MKILYLSTYDLKGGAARGAYRLHRGFLKNNIPSKLLVNFKYSDDYSVLGPQGKIKKAINLLRPQLSQLILKLQRTPQKEVHSINLFPSALHRYINFSGADVVVLHWVGDEMLCFSDLAKIRKPIIWRLADQWAFSGAEHYIPPGRENRYVDGYTSENRPKGDRGFDINKWTWKRKVRYLYEMPMTIVTGSRWLAECARSSYLFRYKANCPSSSARQKHLQQNKREQDSSHQKVWINNGKEFQSQEYFLVERHQKLLHLLYNLIALKEI